MKFWPLQRKPVVEMAPAVFAAYHQPRTPRADAKLKRRAMTVLGAVCFFYGFAFALLPPSLFYAFFAPLVGTLMILVVALLPTHSLSPPKAFEWLFWAFWLTMYLWPNYLAIALPGLPWITVNRLFGGPLTLLLLMAMSSSRPFQRDCGEVLKEIPNLTKCVIGLAIVQVISCAFSANPFNSFNRVVNFQLVWLVPFFVSAYLFRREGRMEAWAKAFVIMAVVVGIICIQEYRLARVPWANSIPSFLKVGDDAVTRVLYGAHQRGGEYRNIGTTMSPLSLAEFMALSSPFLIYLLVNARRSWEIGLLVAADFLIILTTVHTGSRLGLIGLLISHSFYGLFIGISRWRANRKSFVGPLLTLAYPAILAAVVTAVLTIGRVRVAVLGGGVHQASNNAREEQYALAVPVIAKSPLFGFGAGEGGRKLGFQNAGGQGTVDSYILTVTLDYGLAGFFLFFGLLVGATVHGIKLALNARDDKNMAVPATLCLLIFLSIKPVLSQESNNPVLFMLAGMIGALAWKARQQQPKPASPDLTADPLADRDERFA
jgi:O-antigen ligase